MSNKWEILKAEEYQNRMTNNVSESKFGKIFQNIRKTDWLFEKFCLFKIFVNDMHFKL